MNHDCPVSTCHRQVPFDRLMCSAHWKKVPKYLQSAIYRAWKAEADNHPALCAQAVTVVEEGRS